MIVDYKDPTGTNFLQQAGAFPSFRSIVDRQYQFFGRLPNSAFVPLEAFTEMPEEKQPEQTSVSWPAFPKTAIATFEQIDADRASFQDEYVEWRVERVGGAISSITFVTEFPEYYEALAQVSADVLI